MKKCSNCNQTVPDDSIYCPFCGSNQIKEIVDKTVKYCQDCGKKIPKEAEKCSFCGSENIAVFKNGIDISAPANDSSKRTQTLLEKELKSTKAQIAGREEIIAEKNKKIRILQILACVLALAFVIAVGVGIHNYNDLMADYNCQFGISSYCK
ncbi:MAG: zinc ribbon domain-containing protein [Erysipelotrichaceae bacterium]|nr:zinc ribbon domain-containing protein [Erysipelotrichaceae bacterium]